MGLEYVSFPHGGAQASNAQSCALAAKVYASPRLHGPLRSQVVELQKGDVHVIIKISDQEVRVYASVVGNVRSLRWCGIAGGRWCAEEGPR